MNVVGLLHCRPPSVVATRESHIREPRASRPFISGGCMIRSSSYINNIYTHTLTRTLTSMTALLLLLLRMFERVLLWWLCLLCVSIIFSNAPRKILELEWVNNRMRAQLHKHIHKHTHRAYIHYSTVRVCVLDRNAHWSWSIIEQCVLRVRFETPKLSCRRWSSSSLSCVRCKESHMRKRISEREFDVLCAFAFALVLHCQNDLNIMII